MGPAKRVLVLHDLCTTGKVALTNIIPVLSVMKINVAPLPTILLSHPTGGKTTPIIHSIPIEYIKGCVDQFIQERTVFSAVFIGYLGNTAMVEAAKYLISNFHDIPIFFDPIMGDGGKYYSNFNVTYKNLLCSLQSSVSIMTPNITELCLLTDTSYQVNFSKDELMLMCQKLKAPTAVVTGVSMDNRHGVILWQNQAVEFIELDYENSTYHGTGDLFAGVLIGNYLHGHSLAKCIYQAHKFVCDCIQKSKELNLDTLEGLAVEQSLSTLLKKI